MSRNYSFLFLAALSGVSILLPLLALAGAEAPGRTAGQKKPVMEKKCGSECLLSFGIEETGSASVGKRMMKSRSLKIIKVDDEPLQLADTSNAEIFNPETRAGELEEFLANCEPAGGPAFSAPPRPVPKSAIGKALRVRQTPDAKATRPKMETTIATVKKIRLGEHKNFTRVVFDSTGETRIDIEIDNKEKMVFINLPDAAWEAPEKWYSAQTPLVTAWLARPAEDGKGTRLVIRLKKEAKIIHKEYLPDKGYPFHRIIFDLQGTS